MQLKFIGKFTKFADLDGAGFGDEAGGFNTGAFPASTFDEDPSSFAPNTIRLGSKINDGGPGPVPFPKSNFGSDDPPF